jgi:hypothetical protein
VQFPVGSRIAISPYRPDWIWGPPSLLFAVTGALSSELSRPEREADHLPATSPQAKETWTYTPML